MGVMKDFQQFVCEDLSDVLFVYQTCHHRVNDSFCNTHCCFMIEAMAKEDAEEDIDAVDECINTHCSECPISDIIVSVCHEESFSPLLKKIMKEGECERRWL